MNTTPLAPPVPDERWAREPATRYEPSMTERYVQDVIRRLPARQRSTVDTELRGGIAEAVEALTDAGTSPASSERQVLTELGDPARLAASYTDRPLHLIGSELYRDYLRLVTILLSTVPPLLFVLLAGIRILTGSGVGAALGAGFWTVLVVGMHILFWTTAVYALIERITPRRWSSRRRWTPDALQDGPGKPIDFTVLVWGAAVTIFLAGLLVLSQTVSPVVDATGRPIGALAPDLWSSGVLLVIVCIAVVRIGFDLLAYYAGWGLPQALANTALAVLFVGPIVFVAAQGALLNPAFFDAIGWPGGAAPGGGLTVTILVVVIVLSVADVVVGFARAFARIPGVERPRVDADGTIPPVAR